MAGDLWEFGLGFLYKKCAKIRKNSLIKLCYVPEYIEALKRAVESGVILDDVEVFEIVQEVWVKDLVNRRYNKAARRAVRGISNDLFGDPDAWEYK